MLKYPDSLLLAHAGVIADLLELLPAEVTVPVSVPHGEGYQHLGQSGELQWSQLWVGFNYPYAVKALGALS